MIHRPIALVAVTAAALASCESTATDPETSRLPHSLEGTRELAPLLGDDVITQFAFTSDGTLWVATLEGKVIRELDGIATVYDLAAEAGDATVTDLFIDEADRVWATTSGIYWRWGGDRWVQRPGAGVFSFDAALREIAVNPAGDILVATGDGSGGALWLQTGGAWRELTGGSALPSPIVDELAVDELGGFWVASAALHGSGGVSRVAGGEIEEVFDRDSVDLLFDGVDRVVAVGEQVFLGFGPSLQDRPGVAEGGIQALSPEDGSVVSWFPADSGATSNRIRAMTGTADGELWFTTAPDLDASGCETCFAGVGRLDASGAVEMIEIARYGLDPDEYLPWIATDGDDEVHFATRSRVIRVRR